MKPQSDMAIIQSNSTCEAQASKDEKANNLLKKITATEIEIKCARHLADNDPKVRKNALKMLKKWFMKRGTILDKDFSVLWSGLYITFWMSDKQLVQEECAENIAALANILDNRMALKFFESALSILSMEWYGIDQLRMNKFLMLVRRLLRKSLQILVTAEHNTDVMSQYQAIITGILCSGPTVNNLGLKLHLSDIYLEEIAKTHGEDTKPANVSQLIQPFIKTICVGNDRRLLTEIAKCVFRQLMRQSDEGLEFTDKYTAWRQMGFRGGDISCMQLNADGIDKTQEVNDVQDQDDAREVLDPRAGRVNVNLSPIKFDAKEISDLLDEAKFDVNATSMNRKIVNKLIREFRTLTTGEFPLNKNQCTVDLPHKEKGIVKRSAQALLDFEEKMQNDINKNRKRKGANSLSTFESSNKRLKQLEKPEMVQNVSNIQNDVIYKFPKEELLNGQIPESHKTNQVSKPQMRLEVDVCNYDWMFVRPSGTWYVFQGPEMPTKVTSTKLESDLYIEHDNAPQGFAIKDCDATPSKTDPNSNFKCEEIEGAIACTKGDSNSFTTPFSTYMKGEKADEKTESSNFNKSLDKAQAIIKQNSPKFFMTPKNKVAINKTRLMKSSNKKVKIALNLNKTQEIHEHELQVKTSPAIPFDANKKPLKPLLKSQYGRFSFSPINPFAKSVRQRRSLMF